MCPGNEDIYSMDTDSAYAAEAKKQQAEQAAAERATKEAEQKEYQRFLKLPITQEEQKAYNEIKSKFERNFVIGNKHTTFMGRVAKGISEIETIINNQSLGDKAKFYQIGTLAVNKCNDKKINEKEITVEDKEWHKLSKHEKFYVDVQKTFLDVSLKARADAKEEPPAMSPK